MAVATYEDVAVALGRSITSGTERAQVEWWLTGIELVVGSRLGDVTLLDQDALLFVEVEAVAAKVRRGDGRVVSETVSVDDSTVTKQYQSGVLSSDILDEWWALLNPLTGSSFYSTRPAFEADDTQWAVGTPPVDPEVGWRYA